MTEERVKLSEGPGCVPGAHGDPLDTAIEASRRYADQARLAAAAADLLAALREARDYVARDRDLLLESLCVWRDGQPDRSTLSAEDVPMVEAAEAALARIDAALARAQKP